MRTILLLLVSVGGILAQNINLFVCPEDWIPNGDMCYQFSFYPRNYDDAAHECQKNGAILLSIDSQAEDSFILQRLRATDPLRNEWYTSGERDSSAVYARFVWTATNKEVSLSSYVWIDPHEPFNQDITRDILVYKYDMLRGLYGVAAVSDRSQPRNYICEISRNEVYRININKRGFDYGVPYKNLNDVHRGPKFVIEASSTVVISDEARGMVYMECIASGIPQPDYSWIRNNSGVITPISSVMDNRYTITNGKLTIENPSEAKDAGKYQCKVENVVGTIISAPAQLSFASLGEFPNIQAAPVTPLEYQGAVIVCPGIQSKFSQAVVYQWKKSEEDRYTGDINKVRKMDVRPDLNSHIFVSGNGKLYFSEVTSADNYYYYCIATLTTMNLNENFVSTTLSPSRTSKPVRLSVFTSAAGTYEPRIQDSFINVVPGSPVVGMNISLECFAYGTMPLMYSWTVPDGVKGRYELTDSDRVLKIQNIQQDDSGTYKCSVWSVSTMESDSKTYTLYVESKPDFIVPLTDQHLDKGTRQLTWRCEARGVPFPEYSWYKNGERIQNSSDGDRLVFGNTLYLRNLQHDRDSGMYQCIAENTHGVSSTSAQLRILEVKPTFAKFPLSSSMAGAVGGNITIQCRPEAAPFPEISWYRNGANLNPGTDSGSRLQLTIEGDLKIRELSSSDEGTYECRAVNELGEDRNRTFLRIMERTVIFQPPRAQSVEVNKTAFMYCQASFNQLNKLDLVYLWAFNGRIIDIEDNEHFRRGNTPDQEGGLYLIFAQYDHSGEYTCIAQTQVDSANASAVLLVTGPPGEPAGVQAYSASDKITQDVPDQLGVRNTDVVLRWTDPLDTHGAPIQTYMVYGQTNYSTEWRPLYTYIPQIETIIPGVADTQRRQFLVRNLSPGVGYSFKIRAVNMYGVGQDSKPTRRTVIPGDKPTKPPKNVGGGGGSVGTIRITWDALPPEDHNGWGIGYEVEFRKRPPPGEEETSNIKWNKIIVNGNKSEASALVQKDNYYIVYQVKVTPFNIFGLGPTAQNNSVYSAEEMPIAVPTNVFAEPFNESALIVHWDPVPLDRTFMKGELKGFKIDYWLMPPNSTRNVQTVQLNYENRQGARQAIFYGNINKGMIIGLTNNTWYTVTVTVFNNAGNGLKSEVAHQKTDKSAPRNYPVHIKVFPYEENAVLVRYRGVSTTVDEEPLLGYKIRYWRDTDDIKNASDVYCGKNTEGVIYQIQSGYLYHLRVLGYSVGGDGKKSSPETLFTYTRGRVTQVNYDPSTTNVTYVSHDMMGSAPTTTLSCLLVVLTSVLAGCIL